MKTLGLIGGMSWESTAIYYRLINEGIARELGGLHSAKLIVWSFDFAEIADLQAKGDWAMATQRMVDAGLALKKAGADAILICTNTMHKMADEIEESTGLQVLHIADATAEAVKAKGVTNPGLLATRFTMEQDFYKGRLSNKHGLATIIPNSDERSQIHSIIYDELCRGKILDPSRETFKHVMSHLVAQGADGMILGCTEIPMLISQSDCPVPIFDTTALHAASAVSFMLAP